jgi:prephenate dehydrogenase
MAGSEDAGVEAALPYLFLDATYVITPTAATDVSALNTLVRFAEGTGAQVMLMTPQEHDLSAAVISHLPHVLAASILRLAFEEHGKTGSVFQLAAGSFRDMTRVASSPPEIWRDICLSSKEAITTTIKRFEEILSEVRGRIEAGDYDAVERLFAEAQELRATWLRPEMKNEE